jgi:stearoyl-CoA desaturase (delta-9 desaturase)
VTVSAGQLPRLRDPASVGIIIDRGLVVRNRVLNAISIGIPLAGTVFGFAAWSSLAPSVTSFSVFLAFFAAEAVGVGIGLHRYFTHRAFRTGPVVRAVLGVLGSWAMQGPIDRWVADHRRHHRFTDEPADPHSPYWMHERRASSRLAGLAHAHLIWMLTGFVSDPRRYAADILRDPIARWCSRHYWWLCASSLLTPAAVGYALGGAPEGLRCLVWAGCFRVTLLHHVTWSVNSFGHMFGTKVSGSSDESRDNVLFALLLFGEGLHSYHHRHPSAAVNRPTYLDLNGAILSLLERMALVWGLKRYE